MSDDFHISYERALHKAAAYCSRTEHCIAELQDKLIAWKVQEEDQSKIIKYILEEGYIDEKRYALAYAKDKFRYNKWGKIKIALQLKSKQISSDLIAESLDAIDEDDYREMVRKLTMQKVKGINYTHAYDRKAKLMRFLSSKGFEQAIVFAVLEELGY